jgi:hypothetical protein
LKSGTGLQLRGVRMSDRAESLRRFQQLARKVFEEMPEEKAQELEKLLRSHGKTWEADK